MTLFLLCIIISRPAQIPQLDTLHMHQSNPTTQYTVIGAWVDGVTVYRVGQKSKLLSLSEYVNKTEKIG